MRRWLIVGAVVAVVVGGALALAVANLSGWVAANHAWLAERAERELGRPVGFGDVTVSFWGGVGVRIADVRIAEDPDYGDGDFLRADAAQVSVRILPAMFGRFEVRRVRLERPSIVLIRSADGFNVDSLGRRKRPKRAAEPRERAPKEPRELPLVVVALLDVRDGELRWIDRRAEPPVDLVAHDLQVHAEDLSVTTPVSFAVEARLFDATATNFTAKGTVGPVGDPADVDALPVDAMLSLRDADAAVVRRALPELAASWPAKLRVEGPITIGGRASGTVASLAVEWSADAAGATVAWDDDVAKPASMPCSLVVRGKRAGDAVLFEHATVRLADVSADVRGRVTPGDPLQVDVTVDGVATDLAGVAALVPVMAGVAGSGELHATVRGDVGTDRIPAVTGTLALHDVAVRRADAPVGISGLTTTIQLEGDGFTMPSSRFAVDGQPMEASLTVRDVRAPQVELHARGDAVPLAVAGLLPVKGLPADVVRGVVVDMTSRMVGGAPEGDASVRSSGGTMHGAEYTNLSAQMRVRERVATIDAFTVEAYGGTVTGSGSADVTDFEQPKLAVRMKAQAIGLDGLIASQKPKDMQRVSGSLDAEASLTAAGRSWEALQRSVAGTGRIEVRDGVIHDVNIGDDILGAVTIPGIASLLPQKLRNKRPDLFQTGDTRFDNLQASAVIAHETAKTTDLLLSAKAFTVRGAGTLTTDGRVDFAGKWQAAKGLTADVTSSIREARFLANELGLIEIPFLLRGKLPKIRAQPDLRMITDLLDRGILEKGLDAVLGKDEKKKRDTEEKIRRGIDKLFGR